MGTLKSIKIPKPSEELAEFFGIYLGDGGMGTDYQITISFNYKTERAYAAYVADLIYSLFGLKTGERIRPQYGSNDLVVNSRVLIQFLGEHGIFRGNKINKQFGLPLWVFQSRQTQIGAVRGLFDTDGCVYSHRYKAGSTLYYYPKIAFTSYSPVIRKQFFDLLVLLGFRPREYGMRVHLYSQDETLKYYREVGTHNLWHQGRFEKFCEELELEKVFTNQV